VPLDEESLARAAQYLNLFDLRRLARSPMIEEARLVKEYYEGDIVTALPELDKSERPAVINLFQQGIDQESMRIASITPHIRFSPRGRRGSREAERVARQRRAAVLGWHKKSDPPMRLQLARRARWLVAYTASPVMIRPNRKLSIPRWQPKDPLGTYPSDEEFDVMTPTDCIFASSVPWKWIVDEHPDEAAVLRHQKDIKAHEKITTLEFVDAEEITLVAVGERRHDSTLLRQAPGSNVAYRVGGPSFDERNLVGQFEAVILASVPNRAEMCLAVTPGRVTLGRALSKYLGMTGMYDLQAKVLALEVNAIMRGIYQNEWFVENDTGGEIVVEADGLRAIMGHVRGGDIKNVTSVPAYTTPQIRDYLERNQRSTARIPSQWGGEAPTNQRTARYSGDVIANTVDFDIGESQEILAWSQYYENLRAVAVARGFFGPKQVSLYVETKGARGSVTYRAKELFPDEESAEHNVRYPFHGADLNSMEIRFDQKMGTGKMSKRTARELDPEIEDEELEADWVVDEALEQAQLSGLQAAAASMQIPPADLARIRRLVREDRKELDEAIEQVQREAQERQSTTVEPAVPGSPEAQPGIAQPGTGAESGAIQGPTQDIENLENLVLSLTRPAKAARNI
jgi:hypothetical protein